MGLARGRQFHGFTLPRQWVREYIEANETPQYRRIGDVARFDPPGKETPTWEDLDRDWAGDLEEAGE